MQENVEGRRSCGDRPAPACGRLRPSISSGAPCMSPRATATPSRPRDGVGRRRRVRSRHRQAAVDQAGDGERFLRARLPGQVPAERADRQQVRDVPRRSWAGHGLRQRADSAHAAGRPHTDRHRTEGRPRVGARSGQAGRGRVEPAGRAGPRQRRRRDHVGLGADDRHGIFPDHARRSRRSAWRRCNWRPARWRGARLRRKAARRRSR